MQDWKPVGSPAPQDLTEARLQAHWGAQLVAAAGHALLPPRDDDGQSNFGWSPAEGALVSRPLPGELRVGLQLAPLTVRVWDRAGAQVGAWSLVDQTLAGGLDWLTDVLQRHTDEPLAGRLALRDYEMPAHRVQQGAAFDCTDTAALEDLTRWFGNAFAALDSAVSGRAGVSEIRCWPHHFDVGVLIVLDENADPESARTVGCGWSPGDDSYHEPYFYVNPYPQPDRAALPAWSGPGHWHEQGWVGAILTGSELLAASEDATQADTAQAFLRRAIETQLQMLQRD